MTATETRPTVHCPNCLTELAEVVAPGKLKRGPMTVSGPSGRGLRVQCDCGHSFRWLGGAAVDIQDVHHIVERPPEQ
jgi:hypothetical protein